MFSDVTYIEVPASANIGVSVPVPVPVRVSVGLIAVEAKSMLPAFVNVRAPVPVALIVAPLVPTVNRRFVELVEVLEICSVPPSITKLEAALLD